MPKNLQATNIYKILLLLLLLLKINTSKTNRFIDIVICFCFCYINFHFCSQLILRIVQKKTKGYRILAILFSPQMKLKKSMFCARL